MPRETQTDCKSAVGVTVGLINAFISIARVLRPRDLTQPAVLEALRHLESDEDVKAVMEAAESAKWNDLYERTF